MDLLSTIISKIQGKIIKAGIADKNNPHIGENIRMAEDLVLVYQNMDKFLFDSMENARLRVKAETALLDAAGRIKDLEEENAKLTEQLQWLDK